MSEEALNADSQCMQRLRHDLRGRLNGILGFGQLLEETPLTANQAHFLKKVLRAGEDMLAVIDRIGSDAPAPEPRANPAASPFSVVRADATGPARARQEWRGKTVLVIDDELANLELLVHLLSEVGFHTLTAQTRAGALTALAERAPDAILLDIRMPEVSGFDLCREIRAQPSYADTPILFLSGASDIEARLSAYDSGGVDFILKPFYAREVVARVGTQVALADAQRTLKRYAESLEQLVKDRTEQLVQQDRMASLGLMSAGIVHEINNPVTFIKGNVAVLRKFEKDLGPWLGGVQAAAETDGEKIRFIARELPKVLTEMELGAERIRSIVQGLKFFARQESHAKAEVDLVECVESSLQLAKGELKRFHIRRMWPTGLPPVLANAQQISQVLVNLFVNASQAMRNVAEGTLTVEMQPGERTVTVRVCDTGCGIDPETQKHIWTPFFTTKARDIGTGLGLSIVHGIIHDHGGTIRVESKPGEGATFIIDLPLYVQDREAAPHG